MAPNYREMIGTIAGPFKIVERTNERNSSRVRIYKAECVCGAFELDVLSAFGKFQGHGLTCPGHPLKKGMEKPDSGFTYFPDQPEYGDALAAWESARNPDQRKEERAVDCSAELIADEVATIPEVASTEDALAATETMNAPGEVAITAEAAVAMETVTTDEPTAAASTMDLE